MESRTLGKLFNSNLIQYAALELAVSIAADIEEKTVEKAEKNRLIAQVRVFSTVFLDLQLIRGFRSPDSGLF